LYIRCEGGGGWGRGCVEVPYWGGASRMLKGHFAKSDPAVQLEKLKGILTSRQRSVSRGIGGLDLAGVSGRGQWSRTTAL